VISLRQVSKVSRDCEIEDKEKLYLTAADDATSELIMILSVVNGQGV
jgi:hypothetical protein